MAKRRSTKPVRVCVEINNVASMAWGARNLIHTGANGHVECVQCLVDGGADVNAVDNNGMQPVDLAMASVTNREAVLEVLRAADATLRAAHATLSGADACDACADDACECAT